MSNPERLFGPDELSTAAIIVDPYTAYRALRGRAPKCYLNVLDGSVANCPDQMRAWAVIAHCRQQLAKNKCAAEILVISELPRVLAGNIKRTALSELERLLTKEKGDGSVRRERAMTGHRSGDGDRPAGFGRLALRA